MWRQGMQAAWRRRPGSMGSCAGGLSEHTHSWLSAKEKGDTDENGERLCGLESVINFWNQQ